MRSAKTTSFVATGTWTCPTNVNSAKIEAWGGGGAGGNATGFPACGGGGSGGNYVETLTPVVPGTVYQVNVGAATSATNTKTVPVDGNVSYVNDVFGAGSNLITAADDQGFETTTGAWANNTNCTFARSTLQHHTGVASMQVTVTTGGSDAAPQDLVTGVTGGGVYEAYYWVFTANASKQFRVNLQWRDSGNINIYASAGTAVTPSANTWTQVKIIATAPSTATNVQLQPLEQAATTVTSEVWFVDDCFVGAPSGTLILARSGVGGGAATVNSTNGAGGVASTSGSIGATIFAGGNGAAGAFATPLSGGGGGGAGSTGAGAAASGGTAGGATVVGGGAGGAGKAAALAGAVGSSSGGGGSGGDASTATDMAGGGGGAGRIDITYDSPNVVNLCQSVNRAATF